MVVIRKYVPNRASPEGSISKGHETKEVIAFLLTLFFTLSRLVFPNRGMRETEWKRHARSGFDKGRTFLGSSTIHSSTEFYLGDPVCQ